MSTDLHAQLLAAVEARRELALAPTEQKWRFDGANSCQVYAAREESNRTIAWCRNGYDDDFANSRHIAANDPATVIRHCERDLKVLERHGPRKSQWHLVSGQEYEVCCRTCAEVDHDVPAPWPCDEIRDLADAYAVPTSSKGEANDGDA